MRKNIFNSMKLRLTYSEKDSKFQLIRDSNSYGRKYTLDQAYDLKRTIEIAKQTGKYNGLFKIDTGAQNKITEFETRKKDVKNQNSDIINTKTLESMLSIDL